MTRKELSECYQISQSSIKDHWTRVQQQIKKKYGVNIIKIGRGAAASYEIQIEGTRALTLYNQSQEYSTSISVEDLRLQNFNFLIFLTICILPMRVYKGNAEALLKYLQIKVTQENINKVYSALDELQKKQLIYYTHDPSNPQYFMVGTLSEADRKLIIGIPLILTCQRIAEKNNKRNWIALMKTWLAIQYLYDTNEQPFTVDKIASMTELSKYQIREATKLLKSEQIFAMNKAYIAFDLCIGISAQPNAFYKQLTEEAIDL